MSLINQSLVENLFQRPPDRFYIFVVVCHIGVVHIRPIADASAHTLPLRLVREHALLAFFYERLYAVAFDVLLAVHTQSFFHFQLDGKSVRIPPRFSQNVVTFHSLVARYYVLHNARQYVSYMRLAVCRGRSVVKRKLFAAVVFGYRACENAVLFPERDYLFFSVYEI